ncbi:nitrate ABC transporter substrate-binding protein [Desulfonatronum sp. SC1]|nr:nitrate ABC transporter substrate-binding protein [Desulfonatronum sp. SC1]
MVTAQTYMDTPRVMALMVMAGLVGLTIDRGFLFLTKRAARWKYI